jgi:hypothetical protein
MMDVIQAPTSGTDPMEQSLHVTVTKTCFCNLTKITNFCVDFLVFP